MNCLPSICLLLKTPKAETTIAMVEGMRALLISSVASSNLYLSLEIKPVTNRLRNPTSVLVTKMEISTTKRSFFASLEQPHNKWITHPEIKYLMQANRVQINVQAAVLGNNM